MLVLEDSENGCRAAVAAGAWTVAVPSEHTREHEYPGARLIADSLADPRIVQGLGLPFHHAAEESKKL
jgi:pseudouridine 5'-phosphatase